MGFTLARCKPIDWIFLLVALQEQDLANSRNVLPFDEKVQVAELPHRHVAIGHLGDHWPLDRDCLDIVSRKQFNDRKHVRSQPQAPARVEQEQATLFLQRVFRNYRAMRSQGMGFQSAVDGGPHRMGRRQFSEGRPIQPSRDGQITGGRRSPVASGLSVPAATPPPATRQDQVHLRRGRGKRSHSDEALRLQE